MAGGGGKGGGGQTSEVRLDPQTQQYVQGMRGQAQTAAQVALGYGGAGQPGQHAVSSPQGGGGQSWFGQLVNSQQGGAGPTQHTGVNPNASPLFGGMDQASEQAMGQIGGLQQQQLQQMFGGAGQAIQNLGLAGQAGLNPETMASFQSPYQQQVIEGMESDIDRQAQMAQQQAQQSATQAGAFGGSRSQLASQRAGEHVRSQGARAIGQFRHQNFGDSRSAAINQQQILANLGLGGLQQFGRGIGIGGSLAGQQFGMGDARRQIGNQQSQEDIYRQQQALGLLGQGVGPYGQNSAAANQGSLLGGAAGGAMAGSAFGPVGAAIGGGVGLLGGLL